MKAAYAKSGDDRILLEYYKNISIKGGKVGEVVGQILSPIREHNWTLYSSCWFQFVVAYTTVYLNGILFYFKDI